VFAANLETITSARALEIIGLNKKGIKPKSLNNDNIDTNTKVTSDILDEDGLTRFDSTKKKKKKKPIRKNFDQQDRTENNQQPQQPQNREDQHRRGRDGHWNRKDKFHKRNNNNNNNGEQ
jgi:hypothetical protein